MRRGPKLPALHLSPYERERLEQWARRPKTAQGLARRARMILLCATGASSTEVGAKLGVTKQIVGKWRSRLLDIRLDGLLDEPRPGAPRLSQSTILKIWYAFGLQPHRTETFKLSKDPLFVEKVRDIVGLYLNPPDRALVLCVDEKSQIQALDRTQPLLQLRPGQVERRTHDYKRHGTTSLFAALDAKTGKVIGKCQKRHRALEFRKFLNTIEASVPKDLDIHIILDNYGTHKTPMIHRWLLKHPRFHLHFTPTSASWINLVERWFGNLTEKQIRRGVHRSTDELVTAIMSYLDVTNEHPKPFIWTKTADEIFASITRFCLRTSKSGH